MRKSWGAVVLFLAIIALPSFMLIKNIGLLSTGTLLMGFLMLALIPGFLLVALIAPKSSIIERLVIGSITGMALFALGGFISGWTGIYILRFVPSILVYGLSVFALFKKRRLSRFFISSAEPRERYSLGIILLSSSAGSLALLAGVMTTLATQRLNWSETWSYYTDLPWQIAMTAETGQRAPEFFPYVSGNSLAYPYGFHSFAGVWESFSTATAAQLVLQVWPVIYFVLLPLSVSVLAFKVSKSKVATLLATFLVTTFGGLSLAGGSIFKWFPQYSISPTLEFSCLVLLALVWLLIELSIFASQPIKISGWATLVFLSFIAATSKGSTWAVLILFLGFSLVLAWVSKKPLRNISIALATALAGVIFGLATVVKSSGGLTINFYKLSAWNFNDQVIGYSTLLILLWGVAVSVAIFLTGTSNKVILASASLSLSIAASVNLFLEHPGGSELYFYLSAVPLFLVVFSIAIVEIATAMGWLIALPFGLNIIWWQVSQLYTPSGLSNEQLILYNLFTPLIIGLLGTTAVLTWTNFPKLKKFQFITLVLSLSIMSTIGFQAEAVKAPVFSGQNVVDAVPFTQPQRDLLLELKQLSSKNDTVATNVHCLSATRELEPTRDKCDARSFSISAFAERRTLIEGWAYTPNGPAFWDPALLELNDNFFSMPTSEGAKQLTANGVTWLFVDEQLPGAKDFSAYAELINRNEFGSIWRLR